MDDQIKTAYERALERAAHIEADEGAVVALTYEPEGARLAARFMKEESFNLQEALEGYDPSVRKYVARGARLTLESNILLPRNERLRREAERSLEGLMVLKRDKSRFASLRERLQGLLAAYERAKQETYNGLRQEFDAVLRQALRKQMGLNTQMKIDVEGHPEFRQRWAQAQAQIDQEFEERLKRLKEELSRIN